MLSLTRSFASQNADSGEGVAGRKSALFHLNEGLRAVFKGERDPEPICERHVVPGIRPHCTRVGEERLTLDVRSVAFEQAQALAFNCVSEASQFVLAALGSGFVYAQEEVAVRAIQHDAVQRDARTLYIRTCPITDGTHRRVEGGLLERVAEKRLVYGNRDLAFAA
jgi:hypothetical protein